MSLSAGAGSIEDLGVEDPPTCSHGEDGLVFPDEEAWHVGDCDRDAVALVPQPNSISVGRRIVTLGVCEYHLARYAAHFPKRTRAARVDDLVADRVFTRLQQVPPLQRKAGDYLQRLGLDQHGRAHFFHTLADDRVRVLWFNERLDPVGRQELAPSDDLVGWLDYVREQRGWVAVDADRVAAHVERDGS